jgi:AbrB family looped-hinge helix DNA binding protein
MSDHAYYRTRLRAKGQATIPGEVRELLNVREGDDLAFYVDERGKVVVTHLQTVPPDQAWFWTERWQKMEREAQEDINAGRVQQFDNVDEMIAWLDEKDEDAQD